VASQDLQSGRSRNDIIDLFSQGEDFGADLKGGRKRSDLSAFLCTDDHATRTEMAQDIVAQVVLRAPDGSSILDAGQPITASTIARYRVGAEIVQRASTALEKLGFKVLESGPTGFTISGERPLFEQTFDTVLQENFARTQPALGAAPVQLRFTALRRLSIPAKLSSLIAGVVMPAPPELMS
jgi:hypothetical protein